MAVELVTGYAGKAHVSSSEDGARQAGTVGTGMYALETVDEPLKATLENANTVTVGPGDVLINGRHVQLTGSTTFAVPVGTQGMQTSNLLVLRYELAEDETESVTAITLTGEPAASDPQDPTLATGSVLDGDSPVDMPLYRVITTGIESAQPVKLFETVPPIAELGFADLAGSVAASQLPVVPVSKGGTGATNAAAARANLLVPHVDTNSDLKALRFYSDTASGYDFVSDVSLGSGNGFYAYFAHGAIGLRQYTNSGGSQSDVWTLFPNAAINGLFQSNRGSLSDLSRDTLYNLAPGTYLVNNNATNGPESGNYGNLLVSNSAGNRIVGLLAYDNGHVYTTFGASSTGTFGWTRIDGGVTTYGSGTGFSYWVWGKVVVVFFDTTVNISGPWTQVVIGTLPGSVPRPTMFVQCCLSVENQLIVAGGSVNTEGGVGVLGLGGTPSGTNKKRGVLVYIAA